MLSSLLSSSGGWSCCSLFTRWRFPGYFLSGLDFWPVLALLFKGGLTNFKLRCFTLLGVALICFSRRLPSCLELNCCGARLVLYSNQYRLRTPLLRSDECADGQIKNDKAGSLWLLARFQVHHSCRVRLGLRGFSEHCQFGTALEDMLRDRLVCGISDDSIQRQLLAERKLTFIKAVKIATKNLIDIGGKTPSSDNNLDKVEEETKFPYF